MCNNVEFRIMDLLVTGSKGFIGKTLCMVLRTMENVQFFEYDSDYTPEELKRLLLFFIWRDSIGHCAQRLTLPKFKGELLQLEFIQQELLRGIWCAY